jgi:hypothetical protein
MSISPLGIFTLTFEASPLLRQGILRIYVPLSSTGSALYEVIKRQAGDPFAPFLGVFLYKQGFVDFCKEVYKVPTPKRVTKTQENTVRECLEVLYEGNMYSFSSTNGKPQSVGMQQLFFSVNYFRPTLSKHDVFDYNSKDPILLEPYNPKDVSKL